MNRREKFINNVKDFLKYDYRLHIQENVKVMEFEVDLAIGRYMFVEMYSKPLEIEDIERMQKIVLGLDYDEEEGIIYGTTNNYNEMAYELEICDGFDVLKFGGICFFIIYNENCLSWIPLMYTLYDEFHDDYGIDEDVECFPDNSDKLSSLIYYEY